MSKYILCIVFLNSFTPPPIRSAQTPTRTAETTPNIEDLEVVELLGRCDQIIDDYQRLITDSDLGFNGLKSETQSLRACQEHIDKLPRCNKLSLDAYLNARDMSVTQCIQDNLETDRGRYTKHFRQAKNACRANGISCSRLFEWESLHNDARDKLNNNLELLLSSADTLRKRYERRMWWIGLREQILHPRWIRLAGGVQIAYKIFGALSYLTPHVDDLQDDKMNNSWSATALTVTS